MNRVLDAHALMVYLEREPGYAVVEAALVRAAERGQPLLMTAVNWGEVIYTVLRECGAPQAERIEREIATFPLRLVPAGQELARLAATFKARGGLSYADCFAAALARQEQAELLTGDPEFKVVEDEVRVCWLSPGKG